MKTKFIINNFNSLSIEEQERIISFVKKKISSWEIQENE